MKHCILVKFIKDYDWKAELSNIKRIFDGIKLDGVNKVEYITNCIDRENRYDYFLPLNDDNTVLLIDCWENQEALDKHHESPIMSKIIELREKYDVHMVVEKYKSINDLKDEKYIRK